MRVVGPLGRSAVLVFLLLPSSAPTAEPTPALDKAAVDALVRGALKAWGVPGAAVALVRGDEVVYLAGHGVRELGGDRPVTPDTVFPLASCSKAFTTSAMALLVDEGKMHWDDRVREHLDYFHLADPLADGDVRLRDLVTHRTGLRGHDLLWYRSPWKPEEVVRRAGRLPLDRPFRTSFQYQSTMFTAAGLAVGTAARTTWADFVQQRLLDPLVMSATTLTTTAAEKAADRAAAHRRGRDGKVEVIPWYPIETPDPAGSVNSTARDLAKWLRFHLAEGTFAGKRLVSAESLRETHTPQIALRVEGIARAMNPETHLMSYGLGWLIQDYRGRLLVSHAGLIDGFRAHLAFLPQEKVGVVLLCNLHETRMNLALANSLVDLLLGLPKKDWNALLLDVVKKEEAEARARLRERLGMRKPGTRPSHDLTAYTGTYEHPAYGTARIAREADGLVLLWSTFRCPLEHFHYDTFLVHDDIIGNALVTFTLGADGNVATMKVTEPLGVEFKRK
jgi:CubicO group peptidase (beta-lactamase class C family)